MANKTVEVVRNCKTPAGPRYLPVVYSRNARIRPGWVREKGVEKEYKEGTYYLRYYEGRKLKYEKVGDDAAGAAAACVQKQKRLAAQNLATAAGSSLVEEPKKEIPMHKMLSKFLKAARDRGKLVAEAEYSLTLHDFLSSCRKTYAAQLRPEDLLSYQGALRRAEMADRTIHNRWTHVKAFLRFCGANTGELMPSTPQYEKKLPTIYTQEELDAFFALEMEPRDRLFYSTLLMVGLRKKEAMYAAPGAFIFDRRVFQVRSRPEFGFAIKDKEERDVPIPEKLVALAKPFIESLGDKKLLFGTAADLPNKHWLRTLKRLVHTGKLDCRKCRGCIEHDECENWELHKFRRTYCTRLLRGGLDLNTVQSFMGHSMIESTMRYLRPAEAKDVQGRIDAIQWA